MSRFRDRTEDFKDSVRKAAISFGYNESKVASTMASFIIHKPKERSPFTRAAFKTLESIKELDQFMLKHRKDYVDLHRTTEQEKDSIEQEITAFIKACKEQIDILKNSIRNEEANSKGWLGLSADNFNADTIAHKHGVVLILSEKLHSVTAQFDQLRATRFQDIINRAMPRRKPKRITKEVSPVNATLANAESIEPGEIQAQPRRLQQQLLDDETQALQVQKRIKLDDCHKCILLGVSDESKAYRLYDPVTKKITISRDDKLVVSVYVDDLLFTGDDDTICAQLKSSMQNEFEMTDMGRMKFFLGVEVQQSNNGIHICQKKYAKEVLERFNMWNCNSVRNPIVPGTILSKEGGRAADATHFKQLAGCLMYLTVTRPDLMFAVCLIARFMADPKEEHMAIAKRILRYIKGTLELGVFYNRKSSLQLKRYTDSDYARHVNYRKSTSGYVFLINGAAICWSSRKQAIVTLSSTEAEYVAATSSACHSVWLKGISQEKL